MLKQKKKYLPYFVIITCLIFWIYLGFSYELLFQYIYPDIFNIYEIVDVIILIVLHAPKFIFLVTLLMAATALIYLIIILPFSLLFLLADKFPKIKPVVKVFFYTFGITMAFSFLVIVPVLSEKSTPYEKKYEKLITEKLLFRYSLQTYCIFKANDIFHEIDLIKNDIEKNKIKINENAILIGKKKKMLSLFIKDKHVFNTLEDLGYPIGTTENDIRIEINDANMSIEIINESIFHNKQKIKNRVEQLRAIKNDCY